LVIGHIGFGADHPGNLPTHIKYERVPDAPAVTEATESPFGHEPAGIEKESPLLAALPEMAAILWELRDGDEWDFEPQMGDQIEDEAVLSDRIDAVLVAEVRFGQIEATAMVLLTLLKDIINHT
jgi:hypothetical protein